jgi:DNA-binding MarR family transcriptional regulator
MLSDLNIIMNMNDQTENITRIEAVMLMIRNVSQRDLARCGHDLPMVTILLLRTLMEHHRETSEPMTSSELATRMHVSSSAVTQTLNILESKRIIERVKSEHDRRVTFVVLTRKGRARLKHVSRHGGSEMLAEMLNFLGPDDSAELVRIVERIGPMFRTNSEDRKRP